MKRSTYIIITAVVVAAIVVVAATYLFFMQPQPQEPKLVKVGFLGPATTTYGTIAINSIRLAIEEINNKGGVMGYKIELVTYDDENKPDVATAGFRKLVDEDKVVAIFGVHSSAVGLALLPLIKDAKIPVFAMGSVSDAIDAQVAQNASLKYWFRFNVNASMHALMVTEPAKFIVQKYGFSKVGILYDQHAWTQAVVTRAKQEIQKAGLQLVYEGTIDVGKTTSAVPQLTKAKDEGVQVLMVWTAYGDGKVIQRDYNSLQPPFVLVQFDVTGMGLGQWGVTEGSLPYQVFVFYNYPVTPEGNAFVQNYKAKYGDLTYFYPPFFMYDAVYAWASSVEATKSFSGDAVADHLATNGYRGISGRWVFTKGHAPLFGPGYIATIAVQWTTDGKTVAIWPPGPGTADFTLPPWIK